MSTISKQSDFSRRKYNEAKMGAYYTDVAHCRMLSKMFQFPEDEVCCLEPSIGDGKAVLAVTGKEKTGADNLKIFGVELNEETYKQVSQEKAIDYCLQADFLYDVIITQQTFSFCFMNPPYGVQQDGRRYELEFLRKAKSYLSKGAVMVLVLPVYVAETAEFISEWCAEFNTRYFYRFHEKEYEKYRQVVFVGIRKEKPEKGAAAERKLRKAVSVEEEIPLIPEDYSGEKILVPRSSESGVTEFMPRVFREDEAAGAVRESALQGLVRDKVMVAPYLIDNLGRPPIMPSEGQMYLLAVSGAGQGLVGSEENGDLHLQRGTTKIKSRSEYVQDEEGHMKEVEISYPQISYTLIESDGNFRILQ